MYLRKTYRGCQTISSCSSSDEDISSTSLNTSPTGSVVSVLASSSSDGLLSAAKQGSTVGPTSVPSPRVSSWVYTSSLSRTESISENWSRKDSMDAPEN